MMRKKSIALLLSALIVLAMAWPMAAQVNPFSDVKSDHWAYDAIVKLAGVGMIEGYPDGTFGGERTFTRYEMAMVFARMLARLENQIDQRIETQLDDIDGKVDRLVEQVQSTRDTLTERIAHDDELLERIAALEVRTGLAPSSDDSGHLAFDGRSLSPEALDALADQVLETMISDLRALEDDQEELAQRILRLEGSTPSRAEAKQIAEDVIADVLGAITGDSDLSSQVAALAEGAARELLEREIDEIDGAIRALSEEFRGELTTLGVRVDAIEARLASAETRIDEQGRTIDRHGEEIETIWDRLPSFRVTATNKTFVHRSRVSGTKNWEDPRDSDSKKYTDRADEFSNVLTLNLAANPAEDVDIVASFDVHTKLFQEGDGSPLETKPADFDFLLTTPHTVRRVHAGRLDRDHIAAPFDIYTLDAEKFDDEDTDDDDKTGVDFQLVGDNTTFDGFLTRLDTRQYIVGGAAGYHMSDAVNVTLRAVGHTHTVGGVDRDTVVSAQLDGEMGLLEYSGMGAFNYRDGRLAGRAAEVHAVMPVGPVDVGFSGGGLGASFTPLLGKDLVSYDRDIGPDWMNKLVNSDDEDNELDWNEPGDKEYRLWAQVPVLGPKTTVAFGQRDDAAGVNDYIQAQIDIDAIAGLDAGIIFDRRVDELDDADRTFGVQLGANILGADVDAKIISRANDQGWAGAESEQRHTFITATRDAHLFVPVQLEGRVGFSGSASRRHLYLGVGVDEYFVGPVALSGKYSLSRNYVDPKYWWINDQWTSDDKNEFVLGADYSFDLASGFTLGAGYEYKTVWLNGSVDGDPRHTIKGTFAGNIHRAILDGEAKYVIGGVTDHEGNDRDLTTKVNVKYPIFDGGRVTVGGVYVSSKGDKANAETYDIIDLKAGLEIDF